MGALSFCAIGTGMTALVKGAIAAFHIKLKDRAALNKGAVPACPTLSDRAAPMKGTISSYHVLSDSTTLERGANSDEIWSNPKDCIMHPHIVNCNKAGPIIDHPDGGGRSHIVPFLTMAKYLPSTVHLQPLEACEFKYQAHIISNNFETCSILENNLLSVQFPLPELLNFITVKEIRQVANQHGIYVAAGTPRSSLHDLFSLHLCNANCANHISQFLVISYYDLLRARENKYYQDKEKNCANSEPLLPSMVKVEAVPEFPPRPLTAHDIQAVISDACKRMQPERLEEAGCAVCGQLTPFTRLGDLSNIQDHLSILSVPGITRRERYSISDPIIEYTYAIDETCANVCDSCHGFIIKKKIPPLSLASGLWLGSVPSILSSLHFVEKMLIARIRHSCCAIKIASGMRKMKANAIAFQSPISKIYDTLPPPRTDLAEVLAIIFTGPHKPTQSDFARTPLLVRRNHVKLALQWLILNHRDYENVKISDSNLHEYPEHVPPVSIEYREMASNKNLEGTSVFEVEEEDGTELGPCAFTVHGLTGDQLQTLSTSAIKARALQHLNNDGRMMAVGHSEDPESIWNNPQLYPQMFPWLFPYGLGGIGAIPAISDKEHKRRLLMYHDKRFQTDPNFPFVAFSHQQVKTATTNSFLLTKKHLFQEISQRLLHLNLNTLDNLLQQMTKDEFVVPTTEAEKQCFKVLSDLDHVSGTIKGSSTSKKWMRNEIWSLVAHLGAPFWYITLSPADIKNPICIYFASTNEIFKPDILPYDERLRQVCSNPVAGARFFHFVVTTFLEVVLGYGDKHPGLFGDISGYYGTVEQQGRLTLHLHILLWLISNLSPQEMRTQILDNNSDFRQRIVAWIESCQVGEFLTGTHDEVSQKVNAASAMETYQDPTETLPLGPPPLCPSLCGVCEMCEALNNWWNEYKDTTDDLILKSNVHNCSYGTNNNGTHSKKATFKGCRDNKFRSCKARFPRPTFDSTEIDPESGAINIKKKEPWINNVSPALTYLLRCNTDVTCMWSGTALKAVTIYISDYITKSGLKTHVVFEVIKSIFSKNSEILNKDISDVEKARQLLCKIANLLATKTEMGGPMICMYLLGHPDHYTSHTFVPFYWKTFVHEVLLSWKSTDPSVIEPNIRLYMQNREIVGLSPIDDYKFRPADLVQFNLYEWVKQCSRHRLTKDKNHKRGIGMEDQIDSDNISSKAPKRLFRFLPDHPFHESHAISVAKADDKKVVNFIGSPLPRSDKGDREFYCCTMLTLFKPWRSGHDLKNENQTWDEAFKLHRFSDQQEQIMKNLNIKYECLDARDDYRALLKRGAENTLFMYGDIGDNHPEDDIDFDDPTNCFVNSDFDNCYDPPTEVPVLGNQEQRLQREAAEIRAVLIRTGWNNVPNIMHDTQRIEQFAPSCKLTGSQWKAATQLQKKKILEDLNALNNTSSKLTISHIANFMPNHVEIISKYFLQRKFYITSEEETIDSICSFYSLNEEQERAFKIISHHAVIGESEQLKMYVGGMGGTGKTQVIKALTCFFTERGQPYRFITVAPTGTAAALLSGSTYHSKLAINEFKKNASDKSLSVVRGNMIRVDYIFLDEVSMLSCHDLYEISAQLARIFNCHDRAFGGKNMIVSGDFGQLPPAIGGESVALYSRTIGRYASILKSQEEAMGKALWHQFTTVVILRKNMRQTECSADDDRLRTVLMNMRFKDCTAEDIAFLKTRIASPEHGRPSIANEAFCNVSIITARNIQKDEINRLGCEKFAKMTGQSLTHFYSEDSARTRSSNDKVHHHQGLHRVSSISYDLQKELWDLPHSAADRHMPGKLSLCVGMPIMIKHNEATELCITNGQEAIVRGWQTCRGSRNQLVLDTLFVELTNPPKPVQLDRLPKNVVPLTRNERTITCKLRNDDKITITRSQVEVLPNFAMTDFASQGKTRIYNVVDLHDCRTHQAYYTALSRGATASGTIILQNFDEQKVTGKASGALRQEFRELELLDEITKLHYNDVLPARVVGNTRHSLIESYREEKGQSYVPSSLHPSLVWNSADPFLQATDENLDWQIIEKNKKPSILSPRPSAKNDKRTIKRKGDDSEEDGRPAKKRCDVDLTLNEPPMVPPVPEQFSWRDNSCAYDAYFSVLYALWYTDRVRWSISLREINSELLGLLADNFLAVNSGAISINTARDNLRLVLAERNPALFSWGRFTILYELMNYTLETPEPTLQSNFICNNGHLFDESIRINSCFLSVAPFPNTQSIQQLMTNLEHNTQHICPICDTQVNCVFEILRPMPILVFYFSEQTIYLNHTAEVAIQNIRKKYRLSGILYYGNNHFTSRIISQEGYVWYHDGMATHAHMILDGASLHEDMDLLVCRERRACAAIYEAM